MIKGAIFDLDGTLLDSTSVWQDVDRAFFKKRGIPFPDDYAANIAGKGLYACAEYTVARFGLPESPSDLIAEWTEGAREAYETSVPLKEGAGDFLAFLRKKGVALGVATALSRRFLTPCLERLGVAPFFSTVVSTDDLPGLTKEDGRIYRLAAQNLSLPVSDCAAFEDSPAGVACAKAAGMRCYCVADPAFSSLRAELTALSDGYFENFASLRAEMEKTLLSL